MYQVESGGVNADVAPGSKKNWPKCYPLVDHSYSSIPDKLRLTVAAIGYIMFYVMVLTLVLNVVTSFIVLVAPKADAGLQVADGFRLLIISVLLLVIGTPTHFLLVYWTLYKAMRYANIPRFVLSFIGNLIPIVFSAFAIFGWYEYGVTGFIVMLKYAPNDTGNYVGFVPNLIMCFLWAFNFIVNVGIFITTIVIFKKKRHQFKDMGSFAKSTVSALPGVISFGGNSAEEPTAPAADPEDIDNFYSEDDDV